MLVWLSERNLELGFESLSYSLSTTDLHFLHGELYFFFFGKSGTQVVTNSCLLESWSFFGKKWFLKGHLLSFLHGAISHPRWFILGKIMMEFTLMFTFLTCWFEEKLIFHLNKMNIVWRDRVWFEKAKSLTCCILLHNLRGILQCSAASSSSVK